MMADNSQRLGNVVQSRLRAAEEEAREAERLREEAEEKLHLEMEAANTIRGERSEALKELEE